jgi:hypothetical protein
MAFQVCKKDGPVHPAYNPYFSACFFQFLSQQISQQCFSAGLSAQTNGTIDIVPFFEQLQRRLQDMVEACWSVGRLHFRWITSLASKIRTATVCYHQKALWMEN